jgi:hypothetical protein
MHIFSIPLFGHEAPGGGPSLPSGVKCQVYWGPGVEEHFGCCPSGPFKFVGLEYFTQLKFFLNALALELPK